MRSPTFDPITNAVPMCISPDGSSPTYARGEPVRSRSIRNSSRVTTSSEPRKTVWSRSSGDTSHRTCASGIKVSIEAQRPLRQSDNGLKPESGHPVPGNWYGGICEPSRPRFGDRAAGRRSRRRRRRRVHLCDHHPDPAFRQPQGRRGVRADRELPTRESQAEKGPGIVVVIPGIDKPVRVDLRERFLTIPHQTCITKDNAPVDVEFIVYFKVASAADSVIRVNNFEGAAMG